MLRIPTEAEKGGSHRLLQVTPELAEQLQSIPVAERRGRVLRLLAIDSHLANCSRHTIGPKISKIGKADGGVTDLREKKGEAVKNFYGCPRPAPYFRFPQVPPCDANRPARANAA